MMTLALALLLAFAARNSKVKHDEEKGDGRDHMVDDLDAPPRSGSCGTLMSLESLTLYLTIDLRKLIFATPPNDPAS